MNKINWVFVLSIIIISFFILDFLKVISVPMIAPPVEQEDEAGWGLSVGVFLFSLALPVTIVINIIAIILYFLNQNKGSIFLKVIKMVAILCALILGIIFCVRLVIFT